MTLKLRSVYGGTLKKSHRSKSRSPQSKSPQSRRSSSKKTITPKRATKKIQDAARKKIAQTRRKKKAVKKILSGFKRLERKRPRCALCLERVFDGVPYHEICGPNHPFHHECAQRLRDAGERQCPVCRQVPANENIPIVNEEYEDVQNTRIGNEPQWRANERRLLELDWNEEWDDDDPDNMFGQSLGIEVEDLFYHIDMQLMIPGILDRLMYLVNATPQNFSPELRAAIRLMDRIAGFIQMFPQDFRDTVFHEDEAQYIADEMEDNWRDQVGTISGLRLVDMRALREAYNLVISSQQFHDAVEFLHRNR